LDKLRPHGIAAFGQVRQRGFEFVQIGEGRVGEHGDH